jgi:hypothetical protein
MLYALIIAATKGEFIGESPITISEKCTRVVSRSLEAGLFKGRRSILLFAYGYDEKV